MVWSVDKLVEPEPGPTTFDLEMEELQRVLDVLEEALSAKQFKTVDDWLRHADPNSLFPVTVLGVLTITFWGKDHLQNREGFVARAQRSLQDRLGNERAERLLKTRR